MTAVKKSVKKIVTVPTKKASKITKGVVNEASVLEIKRLLGFGLVNGLGVQKEGRMCVEAVVCCALGLKHSDDPGCVSLAVRSLKIRLNDSCWSSNQTRAKGLSRLALAQLGTKDTLDDTEFLNRVSKMATKTVVADAMFLAASHHEDPKHKKALKKAGERCKKEGTCKAAAAAYAAAAAAAYAHAHAAAYAAAAAYAHAAADAAYAAAAADAAAYAADAAYDDADDAADADAAAYAAAAAADKILGSFAENVVQILIDMKAPGCKWLYVLDN